MDYEKKYKEALELMKDCIPDENGLVHIRPCDIFSELKESEDEKIRKAIVKMISDIDGGSPFEKYGIIKKEALAWLKKQDLKFKVGDLIINKDGNGKVKQILEATNSGYTTNDGFAIREIYEKNYRTCEIKDICQWKPSDEQMKYLHQIVTECEETSIAGNLYLESLYNDLKKLREE